MLSADLLKAHYDITTHVNQDEGGKLTVHFKGEDSFNYWYKYGGNHWATGKLTVEQSASELLCVLKELEANIGWIPWGELLKSPALTYIHRWYYSDPTVAFDHFVEGEITRWKVIGPWLGKKVSISNSNSLSICSIDPSSNIVKFYVEYGNMDKDEIISYIESYGGTFIDVDPKLDLGLLEGEVEWDKINIRFELEGILHRLSKLMEPESV